jgi:glycosyltransferase involved in cell wall biosynthesis
VFIYLSFFEGFGLPPLEAMACGIPVITLSPHISSPVARSSAKEINDLYRGPIGNWLCGLSYSQFTREEMTDGTAIKILRKMHGV